MQRRIVRKLPSGLELQQHLNLHGALIPVVFITGHGDIPLAVEAMRHGAFDFLEKPFHDQDLIDRVRRAFEKDVGNRRRLRDTDRISGRLESLTTREREVLRLVSKGKLNKEISCARFVSNIKQPPSHIESVGRIYTGQI